MKKSLIPIGKMAEINHTTIATLRLYDEKGLLKPRYIDPETNYRYYDVQQNARLDMIAYMKELDMSLQEIKEVLESEDLTLIESILAKKNEQIHRQLSELKLRHDAIDRSIKAIEIFRKSPIPGICNLQYIDRRYIFKKPCKTNFYEGTITDYEDTLLDFREQLVENRFSHIHTYTIGTTITSIDFLSNKLIAKDIFIFVQSQLYKQRNDIDIIDSGMYACVYIDNYDDEVEYANKLLEYCKENNYKIAGDYICEVLTEFNVFDESQRNMYLRLQVPVSFDKN